MSIEDYASLEETSTFLRNPANAERLRAATRSLDAGGGRTHDLAE